MILTIDTNKDSPEEMLRVARLLEEFAGKSRTITREVPADEVDPEVQGELFGILDAAAPVDVSGNETKKKTDEDDDFEIVPY